MVFRETFSGPNNDILYVNSANDGATFSPPPPFIKPVSDNPGDSTDPSVAVSGNNVHVVWRDYTPGNNEILYSRSTDGGVSFSIPINLSNNAGESEARAIAVSGNNIHVVWFDGTPSNDEIFYTRSTDGGANFEPTVNLINNAQNSNFPSTAVSGNNVHIVWTHDITNGDEIFYTRSTDGGVSFGSIANLSNDAANSNVPVIAVSGNNVYVAWHVDTSSGSGSFEVIYRGSTNAGASFESTSNLSKNVNDSRFPSIAVS